MIHDFSTRRPICLFSLCLDFSSDSLFVQFLPIHSSYSTLFLSLSHTAELYLRRPPALFPEFRVDRILKRAAERGVKVYVIVYKEVTQTMTMSSAHTKHHLESLHPNIKCFRHPDHLGGEVTLFWSHHEKLVCVDNTRACIGGLDICFGRWDTQSHAFSDSHPTDFRRTVFPGQE